MSNISISNGKVKICHKNTCVDVNGDVANFLTFTFAAVVVMAGISSFLNSSNQKQNQMAVKLAAII